MTIISVPKTYSFQEIARTWKAHCQVLSRIFQRDVSSEISYQLEPCRDRYRTNFKVCYSNALIQDIAYRRKQPYSSYSTIQFINCLKLLSKNPEYSIEFETNSIQEGTTHVVFKLCKAGEILQSGIVKFDEFQIYQFLEKDVIVSSPGDLELKRKARAKRTATPA